MLKEFTKFINRGSVVDLAVGVIVGAAFGKIVSSLVEDILMPLIGTIIGGINFTALTIKIGEAQINYGRFIQNVFDFLIVAFCIFIFIRIINKVFGKEETTKAATPCKSDELKVLEEIRDNLKKTSKKASK